MTAAIESCLRRWPILLLGIMATLACALWAISPRPVYFTQTDAVLLAPPSRESPNNLVAATTSLISTASIIQREIDGAHTTARTSSANVTLYDQGIYDGARVKVPDTGGQWQHSFSRPVLDIQVTGSDPEDVRDRMLALQARITELLQQRQDAAMVPANVRITLQFSPPSPTIERVAGSRSRSLAASLFLGGGLTVAACVWIDLWATRREQPTARRLLQTIERG